MPAPNNFSAFKHFEYRDIGRRAHAQGPQAVDATDDPRRQLARCIADVAQHPPVGAGALDGRDCATTKCLKAEKLLGAGITRAHVCGGRGVRHQLIGRQTDGRPLRIHVRVQVDQTGDDELAASIQDLGGATVGNVGLDRGTTHQNIPPSPVDRST